VRTGRGVRHDDDDVLQSEAQRDGLREGERGHVEEERGVCQVQKKLGGVVVDDDGPAVAGDGRNEAWG